MPIQAGVSCKWVNDSQRLLLEHFDIIHDCPSQLYFSALPLCPSSSQFHEHDTTKLLKVVRVVKGFSAEWGMCSHTVTLDTNPMSLACWNNTVAVGLESGSIIFLNAITGSQLAVLSKHTDEVRSLTFSLDGTLLVSGSNDKTIILWDVQTGGIVMSFHGHTEWVDSVSISLDNTTIASGSHDKTIHLWDTRTEECHCVIEIHEEINSVSFSPNNSQLLISASADNAIQQWDTKGCQIGSTYEGSYVDFSLDGTCFISWREGVAMVQNSDSGEVLTKLQVPSEYELECCCFSPNGNLVAGSAHHTIYVWDITGPNPHLIKTLDGHTSFINSLAFSPFLTSASYDGSVKFWQISISSADPVTTEIIATPLNPTQIQSTSLQVKDGIAFTSDAAGEVKTWDLTTGLCKASFQTPAKGIWKDTQLIEGKLIHVWEYSGKIHIWDAEKEELVQTVGTSLSSVHGIRISGDGSKVFCLDGKSILAWSMWTENIVGKVELEGDWNLDPLCADGSKIWVYLSDSSLLQGWDFGTSGSSPILLPNTPLNRPHLDLVDGHKWWAVSPNKVRDVVTGEEVFQMSGRYGQPWVVQWDGRYLVAGYHSGEVLILDFNCVLPQ